MNGGTRPTKTNPWQIIVQTVESGFQIIDHVHRSQVVDIAGMAAHVSSNDTSTSVSREMTDCPYSGKITGFEAIAQLMQHSLCLANLMADLIHGFVAMDRFDDRTNRGMELR